MGNEAVQRANRPAMGWRAILWLALYYGVAGFGGGYSVLAQLRRDLVERREQLTADEFLILAELSKSLPGSPGANLLALVGQRLGGLRVGVLSAVAFVLPSAILMVFSAAAYGLMRKATMLALFFDGMNAAMVGVVAAVTLDLGRSALRSTRDVAAAVVSAVILAMRVLSEPVLAAAVIAIGVARAALPGGDEPTDPPARALLLLPAAAVVATFGSLAALVRVFVPIGITTFGGGFAMIPAIEHMVVVEQHWIDPRTFADAIALGQITPGPISVCATFIGYRVAGLAGALAATLAMFAPTTALALVVGGSVERFRASPVVQGALRALAPAVIGMLLAATLSLGRASLGSGLHAVIAVLTFAMLTRYKVSPLWPLLGGGLVVVAVALVR